MAEALGSMARFTWDAQGVRIQWSDGRATEFASLWLRDNCPGDRDPGNGQRLVDIADVPATPRLRVVRIDDGALVVNWEGESREDRFALAWLDGQSRPRSERRPELAVRHWLDGAAIDARTFFAARTLAEIEHDGAARVDWLTRLAQDGLAFIHGVPARDRALLHAAALLGFVAETNYGLLFDVRSVAQPENLAYSDFGLGLHTDNPYRNPVPGFQALHVLVASPEGGDSLFADGFAIAEHLRATAPEAFDRLARTPVPFLYRSRDAELYSETPLIRLSATGAIEAVHYNNRSIAPLTLAGEELRTFYEAYRRFALLLREPRFQVRTRLGSGDLVVFDNQRTLHGRTAFSSARFPRHLQGCYLTRDSVLSRLAVLRRDLPQ
ncbi:MAG: TauD/TfdA family dioxygenase [Proteobacteria bacterium]|nr:TauD/TfdA family dioxygenase [Pseudomonadota bacterium]